MLKVSERILTLRTKSNRVDQQELTRGDALNSRAENATGQEYDAMALLFRPQLDCLRAHDEVIHAMGGTLA